MLYDTHLESVIDAIDCFAVSTNIHRENQNYKEALKNLKYFEKYSSLVHIASMFKGYEYDGYNPYSNYGIVALFESFLSFSFKRLARTISGEINFNDIIEVSFIISNDFIDKSQMIVFLNNDKKVIFRSTKYAVSYFGHIFSVLCKNNTIPFYPVIKGFNSFGTKIENNRFVFLHD